jgi:hypothetical protein
MNNQTIITTVEQYTEKVIIDCETKSVPKNSYGEWDNSLSDPFLIGIFYKNQVIQVVHWGTDWSSFVKMVEEVLKELPQPFFGLNWELEFWGLKKVLGKTFQVKDVRTMKGKLTSKKDLYSLLVKHKKYPIVKDSMDFKGELCILFYNLIKEGNLSPEETKRHMDDILSHNMNCVTMESSILKEKEFLENCFEIDGKGWTKGLKREYL